MNTILQQDLEVKSNSKAYIHHQYREEYVADPKQHCSIQGQTDTCDILPPRNAILCLRIEKKLITKLDEPSERLTLTTKQ